MYSGRLLPGIGPPLSSRLLTSYLPFAPVDYPRPFAIPLLQLQPSKKGVQQVENSTPNSPDEKVCISEIDRLVQDPS
jgi:hypothetical protein